MKRDRGKEIVTQRKRERETKPTQQQLKGPTCVRFTALTHQAAGHHLFSVKTISPGLDSLKSYGVYLRAFLLRHGRAGRAPSSPNPPVPCLAQFRHQSR